MFKLGCTNVTDRQTMVQ